MDVEKPQNFAPGPRASLQDPNEGKGDHQTQQDYSNVPDNPYVVDRIAEKRKEDHSYVFTTTGSDEKDRLLRKIDMRVLPICMVIYTLSFLDRSNIVSDPDHTDN